MKIFWQLVWCILFGASSLAIAQETRFPNAVDTAELLTLAELDELDKTLKNIDSKYQVRVSVVTVPHTENLSIERYAHRLLRQYFSNGQNGSVLLLIDKGSHRWYIASDQKIALNNNAIVRMRNAILPSLKRGDYANAFRHYAKAMDNCLENASLSLPVQREVVKTDMETSKASSIFEFNSRILIGAAVISLLISFFVGQWMRRKMSNVTSAWEADHYFVNDSFELTKKSDLFLYTSRALIPKPRRVYPGRS